jgi:ADP-dependent NAD(P)H-hydrate dehydratase / NAD(P)H-hydrate epimerase
MSLGPLTFQSNAPLWSSAATRQLEQAAAQTLPPHSLMQRAGLSVARLLCDLAPEAQRIWIACGPGNNGGDGLEAALHLKTWGRQPIVTWLGDEASAPADALASLHRARQAGVAFSEQIPASWDAAIDALLGVGASRAPQGRLLRCLQALEQGAGVLLHVDLPSGLNADTGQWLAESNRAANAPESIASSPESARARGQFGIKRATLSLLTLKPGLFTAQGRDACGEIWFDDLDVTPAEAAPQLQPSAWLLGAAQMAPSPRRHDSHKGSYGDVAVIGGAAGMQGAALLAARAALHAGAGRVFVGLLGGGMVVDPMQPELMFREVASLDFSAQTVVCGCGGGDAVRQVLPRVLSGSARLVLDADALNAIARDANLQSLLKARSSKAQPTILTPHPLEAARLLGCTTAQVQADRIQAAQALAQTFACTVILKGSGSIIASSGQIPAINPTGDARLATAGTGDVLAGICGSFLAHASSADFQTDAAQAARRACWTHGSLVEDGPNPAYGGQNAILARNLVVPASELLRRLLSIR